ncbi:unnamed protein product [Cuscuta campestris]|uniref:DDE Tnp4 domain-containing protein n=1 Tax=Cuscuta campestris TaxID=132261 RepID=A0A484KVT5_9ASTE|nr:unnamed protein product [Cuscuta campestris]
MREMMMRFKLGESGVLANGQEGHKLLRTSTVRMKSMLTSEMGYDIRNGRLARANLAHIHQSPPLLHPLHSNPGQHAQVACKHWAHRIGPPHPECVFKSLLLQRHLYHPPSQASFFIGSPSGVRVRQLVAIFLQCWWVSSIDAPQYRGRKEFPTQNVLAGCTFDLKFTYILPGWEGTALDSRIIKNALRREDKLKIPEGKYYLVDAGFMLTRGLITPYRGVRYHLKDVDLNDEIMREVDMELLNQDASNETIHASSGQSSEASEGEAIREHIATQMWIDYQNNEAAIENELDA